MSDGARSLRICSAKNRRRRMEWTIGGVGKDAEEITISGFSVVLNYENVILFTSFQQISIYAIKARIIIWARFGEGDEILCRAIIHAMAGVAAFLILIGIIIRTYLRGPYNKVLLLFFIIKEFRCPHIVGLCGVHYIDNALLRPVDKVGGRRITESMTAHPLGGPYEMEDAIRAFYDRRIAHNTMLWSERRHLFLTREGIDIGIFIAYHRFHPNARDAVPMQSILTI